MEKATFAAGCFWGVQKKFDQVEGVVSSRVGYTGGAKENPKYKEVCTGTTGHAEAIEITFDPQKISYEQLLAIFWEIHDPTTPNRQGPDVGSQYRSAIFFHTPQQETLARQSKEKISEERNKRVVTEIVSASTFYEAEAYHQKYLSKN
ncbi:MAG: peptide-methionine (S)-S-oxide reductase MsrA [Chlamydiales bacterium]|nr:peptide-methionine (S)-S-oxide reductase MsrA [Chlamydiales bacterium]